MDNHRQFPYLMVQNAVGEASLRPLLPITLQYGNQQQTFVGLLDSGADVNVLPYPVGVALGAVWENQQTAVQLSGNMANYEARGIILEGTVADFAPVKLAFAWTRAETVPLILGQVNFFMLFDVCFYRSNSVFHIAQQDN